MNNWAKTTILLSALQERYNSMHIIRDRTHTTSIWLLWILLWISGWIIQEKISFLCYEKISFII